MVSDVVVGVEAGRSKVDLILLRSGGQCVRMELRVIFIIDRNVDLFLVVREEVVGWTDDVSTVARRQLSLVTIGKAVIAMVDVAMLERVEVLSGWW